MTPAEAGMRECNMNTELSGSSGQKDGEYLEIRPRFNTRMDSSTAEQRELGVQQRGASFTEQLSCPQRIFVYFIHVCTWFVIIVRSKKLPLYKKFWLEHCPGSSPSRLKIDLWLRQLLWLRHLCTYYYWQPLHEYNYAATGDIVKCFIKCKNPSMHPPRPLLYKNAKSLVLHK